MNRTYEFRGLLHGETEETELGKGSEKQMLRRFFTHTNRLERKKFTVRLWEEGSMPRAESLDPAGRPHAIYRVVEVGG